MHASAESSADQVANRFWFLATPCAIALGVVLISMIGCGDGSVVEEIRHDNGQIKQSKTLRAGPGGTLVRHGPLIIYYEDGTINEIQPYEHDKLEGKLEIFYPSGKKKAESVWKDGRKVTDWVEWDPEGNVIPPEKGELRSESMEKSAAAAESTPN